MICVWSKKINITNTSYLHIYIYIYHISRFQLVVSSLIQRPVCPGASRARHRAMWTNWLGFLRPETCGRTCHFIHVYTMLYIYRNCVYIYIYYVDYTQYVHIYIYTIIMYVYIYNWEGRGTCYWVLLKMTFELMNSSWLAWMLRRLPVPFRLLVTVAVIY